MEPVLYYASAVFNLSMEVINQFITGFVQQYGLLAIAIVLFIETGLLVGFFLPGDTLLFLAGIYAARGFFPLWELFICASIAAILGDSVGYWIGSVWGRRIEKRTDHIFLNYHHLQMTERFYHRHGGKTIVIARFIGFLRTFAPMVAGAARMNYRSFLTYNIFGGIFWAVSLSALGYYLGSEFQWMIHVADTVTVVIMIVSLVAGCSVIFYRLFERYFIVYEQHPLHSHKRVRKFTLRKKRMQEETKNS